VYAISQCLHVTSGQAFFLGGKARIGGGAGMDAPLAYGQITFYSSIDCGAGPIPPVAFSNIVVGNTAGAWVPFEIGGVAPPPLSQSARVSFEVTKDTATQFLVGFDDTYSYIGSDVIFVSGFEDGDLTGWIAVP
jgi:hypothetical protein